MNTKLFINGEFRETKAKQQIINPADGQVIAEVAVADEKAVEAALASARVSFDSGEWKSISLKERKRLLLKISQVILDNAAELAKIETLNTGKPLKESTFMDIPSAAQTFSFFAENLEEFLQSEEVHISSQISRARALLLREPLGVVTLITPWNYPLLIASWKLAQALAAGNTVILKPSSLTPMSTLALAEIIQESGLPPGCVNIISGDAEMVGKTLCSDRRVDMISFTGSNPVGSTILGYATENVKKSIMELGGKSASIILEDADLETAVNSSLCSIFLNQGQMCTAMSRIFIEDGIYDAFVGEFIRKAKRIKLGNGLDFETQMGPLICAPQRQKVIGYVEKAQKEGAKVLCGGRIPESSQFAQGFFFEPTVLGEVTPSMSVFKEEIFGPVACISILSCLDEAVELANNCDYALAACIWTKNEDKAKGIAQKLNAGTVWVNTYGMFFNEIPYGGFKHSGFGKELGREGFLEYTRLKNVIFDHSPDSKPLVNYWYGF